MRVEAKCLSLERFNLPVPWPPSAASSSLNAPLRIQKQIALNVSLEKWVYDNTETDQVGLYQDRSQANLFKTKGATNLGMDTLQNYTLDF